MSAQSLQDQFSANSACFGCGPANPQGLQLKSFVEGTKTVCTWTPQKMHEAYENMLNGGIVGSLLDCHCNWTAAWHLMQQGRLEAPPCCVTAEYRIKLLRPTPTDGPLTLEAHVVQSEVDRAVVEGTLAAGGRVTATCRGTFVAVKPGHPAYHRW